MSIPVNIKDLIEMRVVESSRIEYKERWNPESVMRTICAFANDIENVGGGYVILGVKCADGIPTITSNGIRKEDIDEINRDLFNKCNLIDPRYVPVTQAVEYIGVTIFVIWAYAGENRPYKSPEKFPNDKNEKTLFPKICWIRRLGSTIKANRQDEQILLGLGGVIPFDDRLNREATLGDLNPALITSFLYRVDSGLYSMAENMQLSELAQSMQISGGANEIIKPKNVGLLFFNASPDKFFRYSQIEVIDKPDPTGEGMIEKIFKGPLDRQLEDSLTFIKNYIIKEKVRKLPDSPEAKRVFNYPIRAVEEALANAVYHKAYDNPEPITVTITPEKMEITSLPGPDRSINDEDIKNLKMISKRYRNRRIGNFLKELKLIEGRNTGIPTIIRSVKNNDSPLPIFETDAERSYFTIIFPINIEFLSNAKEQKESKKTGYRRTQNEIKELILKVLEEGEISTQNLIKVLGYSVMTRTLRTAITELINNKKIGYTNPNQPNSSNQKLKKL